MQQVCDCPAYPIGLVDIAHVKYHPLPELSSEFFWQQESSVHISEMSQKCCLYAHFGGLTGPALRDVILDEVSGDKVSMHSLVFLNENILFIAMISCRL